MLLDNKDQPLVNKAQKRRPRQSRKDGASKIIADYKGKHGDKSLAENIRLFEDKNEALLAAMKRLDSKVTRLVPKTLSQLALPSFKKITENPDATAD
jgi:hypothetical protein